ncbi:MAG: hypothetical protein HFG62_10530 [Lachnospiraceae bacterium]|jgi:hypothetical protein|nr:hypothetical protein [Lachnospiraceae bacterium]
MGDVAFEWTIPYLPGKKQKGFGLLLIGETAVFLFNGLFLVRVFLLVAVIMAVITFFLFRSWRIEYEFEYVNGDLAVSRIIRKADRRELYHVSAAQIQELTEGRQAPGKRKVRSYVSNRPGARVYTLGTREDVVYLEPSDAFLEEMGHRHKKVMQ